MVPDQHLDPVCHVVGDGAVLQHHVAAGRVDEEAVPPVGGDVGVGDGHQVRGVGQVQPVVRRVLHLDVVHDGRHAPRLWKI